MYIPLTAKLHVSCIMYHVFYWCGYLFTWTGYAACTVHVNGTNFAFQQKYAVNQSDYIPV